MTETARVPDSHTDWKAIDIFVFSNGQQYSPPRKYHLRTSELDVWESTLKLVAKMQYGPLETSIVDLYTLEGRKLAGPLDLSQGASYVAVMPQDAFVYAGYEKYLIRASRSWEKRQAKKVEDVVKLDKTTLLELENNDVKEEGPSQDENKILKTIASSGANQDSSVIVKPPLVLPFLGKRNPAPAITAKPRSSVQRSTPIRKITHNTPPPLNNKPSCQKKGSVRTNSIKITKPEKNKNSSSVSDSNQNNKPLMKNKMFLSTIRARRSSTCPEVLLPKVEKLTRESKSSSTKRVSTDPKKLSTNNTDLREVIESKGIVLNLYQNPDRELPSITLNPIPSLHEPLKQPGMTTLIDNTSNNTPGNHHTSVNIMETEKSEKLSDRFNNIMHENMTAEKSLVDSYPIHPVAHKVEENSYPDNELKIYTSKSIENITILDSSPQRHLIMVDHHSDSQYKSQNVTEKVEGNLGNDRIVSASKKSETIKYNLLLPRLSVSVEKTHNLQSYLHENPINDQYIAILNKDDVVNLKFNIEIEKRDGRSITEHNDNSMKYYSATNVGIEKESQINIDDLIVAPLIGIELMGDDHRVIVFQKTGCIYCNDKKSSDERSNKSYMIILPVEKVEENVSGCHCSQTQPGVEQVSQLNPAEATHSCVSPETTTKPNQTASQIVCTSPPPDNKNNEIVVHDVSVVRKKSVAINEGSKLKSQEQSRISIPSCEINVKNQLLAVSMESVVIQPKPMKDESTQTEWCQVLLEARLLEDGHYTLHLPPLEMLKYYNLV